jgi:uncharacterized protein GlcG (DUF336 family)
MMNSSKLVLTAAIVVCSTGASAQLPTTKILTLEVAQIIASEAVAKCRADGFKVSVLVVDAGNIPKALFRDDGAIPVTPEVAKMKATTTILNDRASGPRTPPPPGTPAAPAVIPGTINANGGVPIKVDGVTIGAVAVSGGSGDGDVACATAGIAKAVGKLK